MKEMKRILSLFLCLVMLVGYIPVGALAAEEESATEPSETVVETTEVVVETTETVVETTETVIETTETVVETTVETVAETTEETVPETTAPPKRKPVMMGAAKKEASSQVTPSNSKADIDYLFLATDRHADTSVIGSLIDSMETAIGENELDYLGLGGDMVGSAGTHPPYNSSTVLKEATGATSSLSAANVDIVAGIHDMNVTDDAGIVLPYNNGGAEIFKGEKFYVYGVEESCISANSAAEAQKFVEWANGSEIDKTKAIIVLSHYPLHVRRNDNTGAANWAAALNTVAAGDDTIIDRNVAFFWGHNHTKEDERDTAVYHVAPNGRISVEGTSSNQTIYFTYANAGYLKDKKSATLVTITENTITFAKYVDGSVTTTHSVDRVAPSAEPEKQISYIMINEGNGAAYAIGETPLFQLLVNYTDGTSETVDQSVCQIAAVTTVPNGEAIPLETALQTVGEYSATVTYQGVEATTKLTFTVNEKESFEGGTTSCDTLSLVISGATLTADIKDVKADVAEAVAAIEEIDDYVAYDISANLEEGQTAQISVPVPAAWAEGRLNAYYIDDEGNVSDETFQVEYVDGYAVFTVDHFSIYVVTNSAEEDDKDLTLEDTDYKTYYVLTTTPVEGKQYLIVNSNSANTGRHALTNNNNGVGDTTVTVKSDGTIGTYIELDAAAAAKALWTVGGTNPYTFQNNGYYLRYNNGLQISSTSSDWYYNNNKLWSSRYLRYNSGWNTSSNNGTSVYFYEEKSITVATETTYSVQAEDVLYACGSKASNEADLTYELQADGETVRYDGEVWSVAVASDPSGIIDVDASTNDKLVFTGTTGEAKVRIYYQLDANGNGVVTDTDDYKVWTTINVKTVETDFQVEITNENDGNKVLGADYILQNVHADKTLNLGAIVTYTYDDVKGTAEGNLTWTIEEGNVATIDEATGVLTFDGDEGYVTVVVTHTPFSGEPCTDTIQIYASPSNASTNEEDYPFWGQPGSIRYDKTATAVGDFSKTGVAQIELSMAGIPSGGSVDVVLVVDLSDSMTQNSRLAYTKTASKAFLSKLAENAENRLAIVTFNSTSDTDGNTVFAMQPLTAANVTTATGVIEGYTTASGTNYSAGLNGAQAILNSTKRADHRQFVVFLSDGAPNRYLPVGSTAQETGMASQGNTTENWIENGKRSSTKWKYESYTTAMKAAGVTVYTVGLGLQSGTCQPQYLLNDMSGPANESAQPDQPGTDTMSKENKYFYDVEDAEDANALTGVFTNIAKEISAASDIKVEDVIGTDYEITFSWPTAVMGVDRVGYSDGFYLEVVDYKLNTENERDGTCDILQRIYVNTDTDGNLSGIKQIYYTDDNGALQILADTTPGYDPKTGNEKAYYDADGNYKPEGDGTHHMTEGAKVEGGVLYTPNFVYNSGNKMFTWTVTSLSKSSEIALRYFVYLTDSMESVYGGTVEGIPEVEDKVESAPYYTNKYAKMSYTNHLTHECERIFPRPQLTWNGAQVSYVFYLVNEAGKPVNRAGKEVSSFNEAVFVTDVFTESVVWNGTAAVAKLDVSYRADDLLPEGYTLYDPNASYSIFVHKDAGTEATNLYNYFIIEGSDDKTNVSTTKVYNAKAGDKKTIDKIDNDYPSYTTTVTENGEEVTKTILYGAFATNAGPITYDGQTYNTVTVLSSNDFDYSATVVAFAVTWDKRVSPDTVVIDYGLPVDINVAQNDFIFNQVTGISQTVPTSNLNQLNNTNYRVLDGDKPVYGDEIEDATYTAVRPADKDGKLSDNTIRFTPSTTLFNDPVTFYYESQVTYYVNGNETKPYMYSTVTVIPATSIYYEDSFVNVTDSGNKDEDEGFGVWTEVGETNDKATQAQDRPGPNKIAAMLDKDNNYGYDEAYGKMGTFSLGSAKKVTVAPNISGKAEFEFWGTGFDVISMTDSTTGTIVVRVFDENNKKVYDAAVDTYYGYTYDEATGEWVAEANNPDAIYQVPVIKVSKLPYGKYSVMIVASYMEVLDHQDTGSYDFYLDAVRIYNPAGDTYGENGNIDETTQKAHIADGEGWPKYQELRNNVISTTDSVQDEINGIVLVDGVGETLKLADYIGYGPNNELYLAPNQFVVFALDLAKYGDTVAKVQLGAKSAGGSAEVNYAIVDAATLQTVEDLLKATNRKLTTATDMYYDITSLKDKYIVVFNGSDGILSLTDIKVTFNSEPQVETDNLFYVDMNTIMNILNNLQTVTPEQPEDDEVFFPMDVTVELPESVKANANFIVTVTAPEAETVTVNGTSATESQLDGGVWRVNLTATETTGNMDVTVVATDGAGNSTTVTAKVLVYNYTPINFTVTPEEATADVPVTITVTTGDNVAAVRIDGYLVTSYTVNSDNKRVWSYTTTLPEAPEGEQQGVEVTFYSAEGYEHEHTHYVTVNANTRRMAQTVKNVVSGIAKTLMSWFKK